MDTLIFERRPEKTTHWTTIGPYRGTLEEARDHMEVRYARDQDSGVEVTRRQVAIVEIGGEGSRLVVFDVEETIRLVPS